MAETQVGRRRPLLWPWIVGLTVAAVLVWLLAERIAETEAGGTDAAEQVRTVPVSAPASGPVHLA